MFSIAGKTYNLLAVGTVTGGINYLVNLFIMVSKLL